jgi:uncharacterized protein GlcG (DUF336 family)
MLKRPFFNPLLGSASRRAAALGAVMMATVLTNGGEQWACDRMSGVSALDGHFIGWGTGAGTAAKADTTLFTEAAEARAVATITTNGTNATAKYQAVGTLTSASGQTITNAGNLTASSGGVLIVKGDFTGVVLAINDSITFTITIDPS